MTNYAAIIQMTPHRMEQFLDQVYLTGMNNGLYMARLDDDEAVDFDPECYTMEWLLSEAEDATSKVFTDDGDTYLPNALTKAILCNAGIPADIAEEAEGESGTHGFSIKIGASIKIMERIHLVRFISTDVHCIPADHLLVGCHPGILQRLHIDQVR